MESVYDVFAQRDCTFYFQSIYFIILFSVDGISSDLSKAAF